MDRSLRLWNRMTIRVVKGVVFDIVKNTNVSHIIEFVPAQQPNGTEKEHNPHKHSAHGREHARTPGLAANSTNIASVETQSSSHTTKKGPANASETSEQQDTKKWTMVSEPRPRACVGTVQLSAFLNVTNSHTCDAPDQGLHRHRVPNNQSSVVTFLQLGQHVTPTKNAPSF